MKKERLWVVPKFRRMLKKKAADQGISILELTEHIAEEEDNEPIFPQKKERFAGFKL